MNLANKLTLLRVIVVPIFVVFMSVPAIPWRFLWALLLFIGASVTDMFDGKIARKRNMVTTFGKFLDPLADKILVAAALICFVELGWAYAWVVILILIREFAVSGVRLVAATGEQRSVIPANIWGKVKTVFTMIAVMVIIFMHVLEGFGLIFDMGGFGQEWFYDSVLQSGIAFPILIMGDILLYIAAVLTVISGVKYLYDYRGCIDTKK